MTKKIKLISVALVFMVSALLIVVAGFFIKADLKTPSYEGIRIMLIVLTAVSFCVVLFCDYLSINTKSNALLVIKFIFMYFLLGTSVTAVAITRSVFGWLIFSAGICGAFGYWFLRACNIGYRGQAVIKYRHKILEVLIQLALLPVSFFVEICCIPYGLIGGHFLGKTIVNSFFYEDLKRDIRYIDEENKGKLLFETGDGYWKTKNHEIKDSDGKTVGYVKEKTEFVPSVTKEKIDNGVRYKGFEKKYPLLHAFIALPCRIISLVLSVAALFVPHMYISARIPKSLKNLKQYPNIDNVGNNQFVFLDVIIINR